MAYNVYRHMQVRKEKLGDRIAALQQLVAPFGKVMKNSFLCPYSIKGNIYCMNLCPGFNFLSLSIFNWVKKHKRSYIALASNFHKGR